MRITTPFFVFLLTLMVSACNVQAGDEMDILRDEISALTKNLDCDNSEQCKSIGYGDKPCGGFTSYLPYSTKTTPETELIAKVEEFNKLDKQKNIDNNMMGTCEALLQSPYTCQQGKCQISEQNFPNSAY